MAGLFAIEDLDHLFPSDQTPPQQSQQPSHQVHPTNRKPHLHHDVKNPSLMLPSMNHFLSSSSASSSPYQPTTQQQSLGRGAERMPSTLSVDPRMIHVPTQSDPQHLSDPFFGMASNHGLLNHLHPTDSTTMAYLATQSMNTQSTLSMLQAMGMSHDLHLPPRQHQHQSSSISHILGHHRNKSQETVNLNELLDPNTIHPRPSSRNSQSPVSSASQIMHQHQSGLKAPGSDRPVTPQNQTNLHPLPNYGSIQYQLQQQQQDLLKRGRSPEPSSSLNNSLSVLNASVSLQRSVSGHSERANSDMEENGFDISDTLSVGGESCYSEMSAMSRPGRSISSYNGPSGPDQPRDCPFGAKNVVDCRRRKAVQACTSCRKAHVSCDDSRPCRRCVKRGIADQCVDAPRKVEALPKPCSVCPVRSLPRPDPKLLGPQDAIKVTKRRRTASPATNKKLHAPLSVVAPSPSYTSAGESPYSAQLSPSVSPSVSSAIPLAIVQHSPVSQTSPFTPNPDHFPSAFSFDGSPSLAAVDPASDHPDQMSATSIHKLKNDSFQMSTHGPESTIVASAPVANLPIVLVTPAGGNSPPNNSHRNKDDYHLGERRLSAPPFAHSHCTPNIVEPISISPGKQPTQDERLSSPGSPLSPILFSIEPLQAKLRNEGVAKPIVAHVVSLVQQIHNLSDAATLPSSSFNLQACSQFIDSIFPGTPTVIFSPTGMIYACNTTFAQHILSSELTSIMSGHVCIFSLMDIPSIMSVLGTALQRMKSLQKVAAIRHYMDSGANSDVDDSDGANSTTGSTGGGRRRKNRDVNIPITKSSLVVKCRFSVPVGQLGIRRRGSMDLTLNPQSAASPIALNIPSPSPQSEPNLFQMPLDNTLFATTPRSPHSDHAGNDQSFHTISKPAPLECHCTISTLIDPSDRHLWILMQCLPAF